MGSRAGTGFTLIELMVSIAVLAIIIMVAVPSFQGVINGARLTGAVNEGAALLQTARAESIRRNSVLVVCPVANPDTASGAADCSTANPRGLLAYVSGGAAVGRATMPPNVSMQLSSNVGTQVAFRPDGFARNGGGGMLNAVFQYCIASTRPPENVRRLSISSGGRVTTQSVNGNGACANPGNTL